MDHDVALVSLREPNALDEAEKRLLEFPTAQFPLIHRFTPGLYTREIHIPAGGVATTRRHKQEHPFVILEGIVFVRDEDGNEAEIHAPYVGITPKGTRRFVIAIEDTRWLTFHVTDLDDPDAIGEEVTEGSGNPLIDNPDDPRLNTWKTTNTFSVVAHRTQLPAPQDTTGDNVWPLQQQQQ